MTYHKNSNIFKKIDFRIILFLTFVVFIFLFDYDKYWFLFKSYIKFDSTEVFVDLKFLLRGIDLFRENLNPYLIPYNPPFNYPSFWHNLTVLDFINQTNKKIIGSTLILISVLFYLLSIGKLKTNKEKIFYFLLLISPASLLIFERANSDLVIFILLLFPIIFLRNNRYFLAFFILLSVCFKLFPVGALLFVLGFPYRNKTEFLAFSGVTTSLILYYFFDNQSEILMLLKNTPYSLTDLGLTYGASFPLKYIINRYSLENQSLFLFLIYLLLLVFLFLKTQKFVEKKYKVSNLSIGYGTKKLTMFLLATGIFIFTEILSVSWEYRLFFILLTIPQLLIWRKTHRKYINLILGIIFYAFWNQTILKVVLKTNHSIAEVYYIIYQLVLIFLMFNFIILVFQIFKKKWSRKKISIF